MDMVLYSMFKNKIANTPTEQVDSVGGYEIRFVDDIPEVREEGYLYFVLGESEDGDKINVGGKGVVAIVCGDTMIDYGTLNGNVFFDKYDLIRKVERKLIVSTNGLASSINTRHLGINKFTISGYMASKGKGMSYLNSIHVHNGQTTNRSEYTINVEKYLCGLPNGEDDKLDVVKGKLYRNTETITLDGKIEWRNVATYNGYRELKVVGYMGNRPSFLNYDGTFIGEKYKEMDAMTSYVVHDGVNNFVTTSRNDVEGKECVFVSNSAIRIRIKEEKLTTTPYATALQNYLKDNPIQICLQLVETVVEDIEVPCPLMALESSTVIELNDDSNGIHPKITVEVPIIKGSE